MHTEIRCVNIGATSYMCLSEHYCTEIDRKYSGKVKLANENFVDIKEKELHYYKSR